MAKALRPIVGGVTKTSKKAYVTVEAKHRKVKRIYGIMGNITRLAWSGSAVTYLGSPAPAPIVGNYKYLGGSDNYGFVSGGLTTDGNTYTYSPLLEPYTTSLTKATALTTAYGKMLSCWASTKGYIAFAGGYRENLINTGSNTVACYNDINLYDPSLVKITATANLYKIVGYGICGASVGDYMCFVGGAARANVSVEQVAVSGNNTAVTTGGVVSILNTTHSNIRNVAGVSNFNGYALFGGGYASSSATAVANVDSISSSLVKGTLAVLSSVGAYGSGKAGNYALFVPKTNEVGEKIPEAYNTSLVKITSPASTQHTNNAITLSQLGSKLLVIPVGTSTTGVDTQYYDENLVLQTVENDGLPIQYAAMACGFNKYAMVMPNISTTGLYFYQEN